MKLLEEIAADCMDAYNQEYVDDNETFFDQQYFERACADAYSDLMDNQYQNIYAALRADNKHRTSFVELDPIICTSEKVSLEKDGDTGYWKAVLKGRIISFKYDQSSCGVQSVSPEKRGACILVRSKQVMDFLDSFMPPSKVVNYWPISDNEIRFDSGCCKDVFINFVSSPHPKLKVQDGLAHTIKTNVLNLMFGARKGGQPSDPSNDSSKVISNEELSKEIK